MNYKEIYNEDYFCGKTSFFYKFGYGKALTDYFKEIYKPIAKYAQKNGQGRVLDVGCAYGFMLEKFPDSYEKFGIDISEYAISIAMKKIFNATFKIAGAEDGLLFGENFFDIVIMNDILEHLEKPELALKNVFNALKKGGILYITTPNFNIIRKKVFSYADRKEHHISLFSHYDLEMLLKKTGFETIDHWTFWNIAVGLLRFNSNKGSESAFICKKY